VKEHDNNIRNNEYATNRKLQRGSGICSEKIRTYNFINSRIVDHRLNKKTSKLKDIMKGNLSFIYG